MSTNYLCGLLYYWSALATAPTSATAGAKEASNSTKLLSCPFFCLFDLDQSVHARTRAKNVRARTGSHRRSGLRRKL